MSTPTKLGPTDAHKGTDLGDEFLFYDGGNDRVHVLNATAREIFLLFDGSRSEDEVVQVFAERHGLDEHQARGDVLETVRRLRDLGLLGAA